MTRATTCRFFILHGAFILSIQWVELLTRSANHEYRMAYTTQGVDYSLPQSGKQSVIKFDIGNDVCEEEIFWWRSILCYGDSWDATTTYNGRVNLSPWSVPLKNAEFTLATKITIWVSSQIHQAQWPLSNVSLISVCTIAYTLNAQLLLLEYSAFHFSERGWLFFCLQDQVLVSRESVLLVIFLKSTANSFQVHDSKFQYVGLRSLLCSTFFNADIECNLASAWLNPAFAVLELIRLGKSLMATLLASRQPHLGILWSGAILTDQADSVLRDIQAGMTALDLPAFCLDWNNINFLNLRSWEESRWNNTSRWWMLAAFYYSLRRPWSASNLALEAIWVYTALRYRASCPTTYSMCRSLFEVWMLGINSDRQ